MPLARNLKRALADLAERSHVAKAPRTGYFSVLDELVQDLPTGRALSRKEALERLKAGTQFKVDDMSWPLKQEEIDYDLHPALDVIPEGGGITKDALLNAVREKRPGFHAQYDMTQKNTTSPFEPYSTKSARRIPDSYFESLTDSPDFGKHHTHFGDRNLTFSRGAAHNIGADDPEIMRLIDEIQSDRANDARKVVPDYHTMPADPMEQAPVLDRQRGWVSQEELAAPQRKNEYDNFPMRGVPDMPFKDPGDYGRLEIKNALLDAIANDQHGVGITSKSPVGLDADMHTYRKVYPGQLRRIADQYGGDMTTASIPVRARGKTQWQNLRGAGDIADFFEAGNLDDIASMRDFSDLAKPLVEEIASHNEHIMPGSSARARQLHAELERASDEADHAAVNSGELSADTADKKETAEALIEDLRDHLIQMDGASPGGLEDM